MLTFPKGYYKKGKTCERKYLFSINFSQHQIFFAKNYAKMKSSDDFRGFRKNVIFGLSHTLYYHCPIVLHISFSNHSRVAKNDQCFLR